MKIQHIICAVENRMKDHNRFEYIQHFLFYDLNYIDEIHLSNNQLAFVHPHAFSLLGLCLIIQKVGFSVMPINQTVIK